MAQVVYAKVPRDFDFADAASIDWTPHTGPGWSEGAQARCGLSRDFISLVGNEHPTGKISVYFAGTRCSDWQPVNHLVFLLAQEFNRLGDSAEFRSGGGIPVRGAFTESLSHKAVDAARHLVTLECGIDAPDEALKSAIIAVMRKLEALGTVTCDYVYAELQRAYNGTRPTRTRLI